MEHEYSSESEWPNPDVAANQENAISDEEQQNDGAPDNQNYYSADDDEENAGDQENFNAAIGGLLQFARELDMAAVLVDLGWGPCIVFKKLTGNDVRTHALRINEVQARVLFPSFNRESFQHGDGGRIHTIEFQVTDESERNYNEMRFVGYLCREVKRNGIPRMTCEIKGQWRQLVGQNRLGEGDDIRIYRCKMGDQGEHRFHFKFFHRAIN